MRAQGRWVSGILLLVAAACGGTDAPEPDATNTAGAIEWRVEAGPPLPVAVANNGVAAGRAAGRDWIVSALGIGAAKDHAAITRAAWALDVAAGRWEPLPDVPGDVGRIAPVALAVGPRVFVIGGYAVAPDGHETTSPAVNILDLATRQWSRGADPPVPVDDTVAGVWQDRYLVLVSGWSTDKNVADVQIYDTVDDRWMAATPIPGTPVFGHAGGLAGNTFIYCGGAKMNAPHTPRYLPTAECWRGDLDPAAPAQIAWRAIAHHPGAPRYRAAAGPVRVGDMAAIMFAGGTANPYNINGIGYDTQPSEPEAPTFLYDVARDAWLDGPTLPTPTMDHRGLVSTGDAWWIVGGFTAGQTVTTHVTTITASPR